MPDPPAVEPFTLQIVSVVPAGTPTFCGNSTARPAIVILPCWGTMSVVLGLPAGEESEHLGE